MTEDNYTIRAWERADGVREAVIIDSRGNIVNRYVEDTVLEPDEGFHPHRTYLTLDDTYDNPIFVDDAVGLYRDFQRFGKFFKYESFRAWEDDPWHETEDTVEAMHHGLDNGRFIPMKEA